MVSRDGRVDAIRRNLSSGMVSLGSWLSFGSAEVCEIVAKAGFDWLVVDTEHTAIGVADQLRLIQVIDLVGLAAFVRVGANDELLIKRALDAGAHGVIVPKVNSREEAVAAVSAAHYPPRGHRGVGLSRAQGYGLDFDAYRGRATRTFVAVQVEHIDAVEHLEDILSVDGVDAFIVGPYDLSGSVGAPGDWEAPEVVSALEEIGRVLRAVDVPAGFHVVHSGTEELQRRIDQGYRFIAYGDDMVFLAEKFRTEVSAARALLGGGS